MSNTRVLNQSVLYDVSTGVIVMSKFPAPYMCELTHSIEPLSRCGHKTLKTGRINYAIFQILQSVNHLSLYGAYDLVEHCSQIEYQDLFTTTPIAFEQWDYCVCM